MIPNAKYSSTVFQFYSFSCQWAVISEQLSVIKKQLPVGDLVCFGKVNWEVIFNLKNCYCLLRLYIPLGPLSFSAELVEGVEE